MDMSSVTLDDIMPKVGDVADQNLGLFALIWYYCTIPYNLFLVWPSYYVGFIIWWPVYTILYYTQSLLSIFGLSEVDVPLWKWLLFYPDSYAPVFYFDFFWPAVTEDEETTDETAE